MGLARELEQQAQALGMAVLIEVHDQPELERAPETFVAAHRHQQSQLAQL